MGINFDDVQGFIALAGDDFEWAGVRGSSRVPAKYLGRTGFRQIFRDDLLARQGGLCAVCGGGIPAGDVSQGEINHVVSQGPSRKGWMPGNVFVGHPACNTRCEREAGTVAWTLITRPDVIPTEWTPFPILARS